MVTEPLLGTYATEHATDRLHVQGRAVCHIKGGGSPARRRLQPAARPLGITDAASADLGEEYSTIMDTAATIVFNYTGIGTPARHAIEGYDCGWTTWRRRSRSELATFSCLPKPSPAPTQPLGALSGRRRDR